MGERAKLGLIGMLGWGPILIVYLVYLRLQTPTGVVWDGYATAMAVLIGLSFIAGLVGNQLDYRQTRRNDVAEIEALKQSLLGRTHEEWVRSLRK